MTGECRSSSQTESALEAFPAKLLDKLEEFIIDKRTGNIIVNIKDGRIVGLRADEILSVK